MRARLTRLLLVGAASLLALACTDSAPSETAPAQDASAPLDTGPDAGSETDAVAEPAEDTSPGDAGGDRADATTPPPLDAANWMSDLLAAYPDRALSLSDIASPRSHDTGTYLLTTCELGAGACNTQTQHLSMREQLDAGARFFDVRPRKNDDGDYMTYHRTGCNDLGCDGDSMLNVLTQTREFLDAHAELVVLELQHFCNTSRDDPDLIALVAETLGDRMLRLPENDQGPPLISRPLAQLLGDDGGGRVLVRWSGLANTAPLRAEGRFAPAALPIAGSYANAQSLDVMIEDQVAKYAAFDPQAEQALFKLTWTMTMDAEMAITCALDPSAPTLRTMATETHEALPGFLEERLASGDISAARHPHIISVDYLDEAILEQVMKVNSAILGPERDLVLGERQRTVISARLVGDLHHQPLGGPWVGQNRHA
jgi:hypothetical protein